MGDSGHHARRSTPSVFAEDSNFDILDWWPAYQSCQRYFVDVAQYETGTQALCSLINIRLPFQYATRPVTAFVTQSPPPSNATPYATYPLPPRAGGMSSPTKARNPSEVTHLSLIPYIRRLVVTGFDKPAILHGFFGDDFTRGIMPHVDCERRNYLFSAKSGGWGSCKRMYDSGSKDGSDETVPFMKPLTGARPEELLAADKSWSEWLAMEDWMIGPRAPSTTEEADVVIKTEAQDDANTPKASNGIADFSR